MKKLLLTLIILTSLSNQLLAESSIATIDINVVMNNLEDAKDKKETLNKEASVAKKKIEIKRKVLKEKELKMQARGVEMDSSEASDYRKELRDFERFVRDTEADLKSRFLKTNKELTEKVLETVENYAENNKIDLVLDSSQRGRSSVLYDAKSFDITEEVINKLND